MNTIPIHEAKANLSKYVRQAKAGDPVYIGYRGKTEVVLSAVPKGQSVSLWGSMKGQFQFSNEDWNRATSLLSQDFENSKTFPDAD